VSSVASQARRAATTCVYCVAGWPHVNGEPTGPRLARARPVCAHRPRVDVRGRSRARGRGRMGQKALCGVRAAAVSKRQGPRSGSGRRGQRLRGSTAVRVASSSLCECQLRKGDSFVLLLVRGRVDGSGTLLRVVSARRSAS
jgi:hypothetical protein